MIAYLGVPLITSRGIEIGAFCAIDTSPRIWAAEDVALVRDLAAAVVTLIEMRTSLQEVVREEQTILQAMEALTTAPMQPPVAILPGP